MDPRKRSLAWLGRVSWQHVLFFCVVANLPVWIAERAMGAMSTGWFNLDFLAVGILSLYLPRVGTGVLLGAALLDELVVVCQTYYLLPSQAIRNLSAIEQMPGRRIAAFVGMALVVALIAGASIFLERTESRRNATALCFVFLGCALVGTNRLQVRLESGRWLSAPADTLNVSHSLERRAARVPSKWLMTAEMDRWFWPETAASARIHADEMSASGASEKLTGTARSENTNPDIVLILVESWGQANEPTLRDALVQDYSRLESDRYRIVQGTVPFNGPTVAGEVRELCDSDGAFRVLDAPAQELKDCLPRRLTAMGYRTTAIHGMTGQLFRRDSWYPKLGFQEMLFREELEAQGLPDCPGAFKGTCDASIAEWIGNRLEHQSDQPRFTYWVTLNSHLPVPDLISQASSESCSVVHSNSDQVALCNWFQLVQKVHRAVAEMASRKLARPTMFIVVGDHAPPFEDPVARDEFDPTAVPFVILAPRETHGRGAFQDPVRSTSQETPATSAGG